MAFRRHLEKNEKDAFEFVAGQLIETGKEGNALPNESESDARYPFLERVDDFGRAGRHDVTNKHAVKVSFCRT